MNKQILIADGSKELYPKGVPGGRAFMEPNLLINFNISFPEGVFHHNGRHFVYAKKNEVLTVASSAQGIHLGGFNIISPSGQTIANPNSLGRIGVILTFLYQIERLSY